MQESEGKYRNLIEMAPDGIMTIDMRGIITSCNTAGLAISGYSKEEVIGKHVTRVGFIRARDLPKYLGLLASAISGKISAPVVLLYRHKDGTTGWVEAHYALLEENGGKTGIQLIVRDITERKLAAEKEKEYIRSLEFLQKTAMGFVELSSEDDIYQFIGDRLQKLVSNSIVVISAFDRISDILYATAVCGLGRYARAVARLLGRNPVGASIKSTYIGDYNLASTGLVKLSGGIHELSSGTIPRNVSLKLERLLGLGDMYCMGFVTEGDLFGAAFIFLRKGAELVDHGIIETFINQAAVALRNRQAAEQIKASLAEKEVLLREIHHRVKNNLQVISSLINLQAEHVSNELALQVLGETQSRVRSMALIHEKLYRAEDLSRINFAEYTRDLVNYLFRMYEAKSRNVRFEMNIGDLWLDVETAIPCGLIVNELVSNSLKHAFPPANGRAASGNKISIDFQPKDNSTLTLTISDNGIGLPADLDFRNTESLGLQLVNTLTDQLGGDIEFDGKSGATFRITFAGSHKI